MKYIHKKTKAIARPTDGDPNTYYLTTKENFFYIIPKEILENSNDWEIYNHTPEDIKKLMDIPCLSINDVAKVFVTANRESYKSEWGLDKNARELVKIVIAKTENTKNNTAKKEIEKMHL